MSKFNVGDRVQLTEESVRYYEGIADPNTNLDWNKSGRVAKISRSFSSEGKDLDLYIVSGFPLGFYGHELEYEDMRKNG